MSNSKVNKFENHFTAENCLGRIAIALAAHPFDYCKILIQLGFEPLPAYPSKTIFGRQRLALPGVFKYLGHIRRTDGFFGIYRGISYKLTTTLINGFVYVNVNEWQKQLYPSEVPVVSQTNQNGFEMDVEKLQKLLLYLGRETVSRFIALSISYPFHVMTVRICAQFIGREQHYDSVRSAVVDIYQTGGFSGFYAGFVPRFLGDCLVLWLGSSIIFVVNSWIDGESAVKSYVSASINFIVASLMYPFQLVSTVMACNGSNARSLAASAYTGPEFSNWIDCWKNLSELGQLKRGSSLLWRYQTNLTNAPLYHYNRDFDQNKYKLKEW
jgi:carrier protein